MSPWNDVKSYSNAPGQTGDDPGKLNERTHSVELLVEQWIVTGQCALGCDWSIGNGVELNGSFFSVAALLVQELPLRFMIEA